MAISRDAHLHAIVKHEHPKPSAAEVPKRMLLLLGWRVLRRSLRGVGARVGRSWPWWLAASLTMNVALMAGIVEYARHKDVLGAVQQGGSAFTVVAAIAVVIVLAFRR